MIYTLNDLQIYIPTFNRAEFLKESLESLVFQTAGVPNITVFNNESTDHTSDVIKSFSKYGVKEFKSQGSLLECMNKVKNMTSSKYVMIFHDDDILNRKYLEFAIKALNTYPNIAFITTRTKNFTDKKEINKKDALPSHYLFSQQIELSAFMYVHERVALQPTIYKFELFKEHKLDPESFGKFFDWPYLVNLSNYGNVVVFSDLNMFWVRIHKNQWTWDRKNSVWKVDQMINWHKCFFEALHAKEKFSTGSFCFYSKFEKILSSHYELLIGEKEKKRINYEDSKNLAYQYIGAEKSLNLKCYNELNSVIFNFLLNKKLRKNFKTIEKNESDNFLLFMLQKLSEDLVKKSRKNIFFYRNDKGLHLCLLNKLKIRIWSPNWIHF